MSAVPFVGDIVSRTGLSDRSRLDPGCDGPTSIVAGYAGPRRSGSGPVVIDTASLLDGIPYEVFAYLISLLVDDESRQ